MLRHPVRLRIFDEVPSAFVFGLGLPRSILFWLYAVMPNSAMRTKTSSLGASLLRWHGCQFLPCSARARWRSAVSVRSPQLPDSVCACASGVFRTLPSKRATCAQPARLLPPSPSAVLDDP